MFVHGDTGNEHEGLWSLEKLARNAEDSNSDNLRNFQSGPGLSEVGAGELQRPNYFLKFVPFAKKGSEIKLMERRFKTSRKLSEISTYLVYISCN